MAALFCRLKQLEDENLRLEMDKAARAADATR